MQITICSDIHDNIWKLADALPGMNDGDARLLSQVAAAAGNVTLHGELAELDLDGFRVAVNHYPEIAVGLAASGRYRLVCYGHDHTLRHERQGATWLVNPGEMMGRFGRSTYVILDTTSGQVSVRQV